MRISSANSVCSARMANSLSGCSRAARDFLDMSCVLERVVPHPEGFVDVQQRWLPSSASGCVCVLLCFIRRQSSCSWFVPTSWAKKRKKSGLKIRTTKNYSTYLAPFHTNGCMAGTGIVRLLSKATNTGFSRYIKTGCHLPVCITIRNKSIRAHKKLYIYKYIYIYIYI